MYRTLIVSIFLHASCLTSESRQTISMLPVELLEQIVGHLKSNPYGMPATRDEATLANLARVSKLLYDLTMPLLWDTVS